MLLIFIRWEFAPQGAGNLSAVNRMSLTNSKRYLSSVSFVGDMSNLNLDAGEDFYGEQQREQKESLVRAATV